MNVNKASFLRVNMGLLLLGATNTALGQTKESTPDENIQARYEQATKLMQANKPTTACPILEEVVTAAPQYSAAKQALADCYVLGGKLLSASRLYEAMEKEAADAGQDVARKLAADKRHALAARLSHLRIVVPPSLHRVKGLVILRDGEKLAREEWGEAFPADRGPHKIEAQILGDSVWKTVADVWEEGATLEVSVDVYVPYCVGRECPPGTNPKKPPFWTSLRVAGLTIGAFGVAGLGIGAGFGGAAMSKKNESNDGHCNKDDQCDDVGLQMRSDSLLYGNVSTGMFIAGGILAGAGVIMFAVLPSKKDMRTTVGIGPQGVVVRGQF